MKFSIVHSYPFPKSFSKKSNSQESLNRQKNLFKDSKKVQKSFPKMSLLEKAPKTSQRSYKSAKFLEKRGLSKPKTFAEISKLNPSKGTKEIETKGFMKGSESVQKKVVVKKEVIKKVPVKSKVSLRQLKVSIKPLVPVIPVVEEISVKKSFPCLFVTSLEKKNEVLGTSLMNRFVRFLTKKGKKSKASLFCQKAFTLLAQSQAEKNDSILSESKNHEFKKKSGKLSSNFQTYKSQKHSQLMKMDSKDLSPSLSHENKESGNHLKSLTKKSLTNDKISFLSSPQMIEQAVSHVKPFVEVKKVRVAGSTYQVPAILEKNRQDNFAIKWILQSAFERHKKNPSQPLEYFLASEMYEASQKQGQARMKRNELHKLAESHRAFAHFRWW